MVNELLMLGAITTGPVTVYVPEQGIYFRMREGTHYVSNAKNSTKWIKRPGEVKIYSKRGGLNEEKR